VTSRIRKALAAAAATTALVIGAASSSSAAASVPSLPAFGISADGKLMAAFTTDRPDTLNWFRRINGLVGDAAAIGIDFRVQDGLLYVVGDKGGVYTVKTPPQVTDPVVTKVSQLTVTLYGTNFGVDFNPAADRLRIISDNGQNLAHNLNDHTTTEQSVLTTPPSQAPTKAVTAAAYTNNDLHAATATTLYDINTGTDQLVIQSPPAEGKLVANGSLVADAALNAGFDIYSDLTAGKTTSVLGFATLLLPDGSAELRTVNLFTGETATIGQFPLSITDVAVALDTV
jgi:Domain of unknown function (DUF4394)